MARYGEFAGFMLKTKRGSDEPRHLPPVLFLDLTEQFLASKIVRMELSGQNKELK